MNQRSHERYRQQGEANDASENSYTRHPNLGRERCGLCRERDDRNHKRHDPKRHREQRSVAQAKQGF